MKHAALRSGCLKSRVGRAFAALGSEDSGGVRVFGVCGGT